MSTFQEVFQRVIEEARKVSGISDIERTDFYEPLKTVVYDLLQTGMGVGDVIDESVSWLRQNVQIEQSSKRI